MEGDPSDPRVYLAVERTFLAWIRTGVALMGFGLVLARFDLLMQELRLVSAARALENQHSTIQFGIALVVIGVAVNVVAAVRYKKLLARIDRGEEVRAPSWLAIWIALLLAAIGSVIAARLVLDF